MEFFNNLVQKTGVKKAKCSHFLLLYNKLSPNPEAYENNLCLSWF